ncbi:MAG: hypothetical protein IKJ35_04995, partial [Clostridia bacterium]|nr:hypothetical protein [Clostridia bacterium]
RVQRNFFQKVSLVAEGKKGRGGAFLKKRPHKKQKPFWVSGPKMAARAIERMTRTDKQLR